MKYLAVVFIFLTSACFAADGSRHRPYHGSFHGSYHHGYHGSYYRPYCGPYYPYVSPVVVGVPSGYYETRTETVMVVPERIGKQWVEPVFVTRYDSAGRPFSEKVSDGYYREVVIPARYETQVVRVWVPSVVAAPVVAPAPSVVGGVFYGGRHVSVGVGFGF